MEKNKIDTTTKKYVYNDAELIHKIEIEKSKRVSGKISITLDKEYLIYADKVISIKEGNHTYIEGLIDNSIVFIMVIYYKDNNLYEIIDNENLLEKRIR